MVFAASASLSMAASRVVGETPSSAAGAEPVIEAASSSNRLTSPSIFRRLASGSTSDPANAEGHRVVS